MKDGYGYNERLFSGGVRGRFHLARFHWVSRELVRRRFAINSVLELGCFDGKLIEFLPAAPKKYVGYDANWEGGLDIAAKKWGGHANFTFYEATQPDQMTLAEDERSDVAVSMETLEHVPPHLVDGYLRKIAHHLDGYLFVTVPNEKERWRREFGQLGKWKKLGSESAIMAG
ncbi:class I SAM-dependent methyltransferase, partial [Caballeronia sp. RCC_10]|uniref:class I SAM-dependent methyltransferase n=1 Tax=Caballeronia sp. RCC_10 TaxID=3239227 RepID=UPI003523E985